MHPRIGVSTLTYSMMAGPFANKFAKLVRLTEQGLGLQLVMFRGMNPPNMQALLPHIISSEALFVPRSPITRWFFDAPDLAKRSYHRIRRKLVPGTPALDYFQAPFTYAHVYHACKGIKVPTVSDVTRLYQENRIGGIVMDTAHNFELGHNGTGEGGAQEPFSNTPEQFAEQLAELVACSVPIVFHLQPSRLMPGQGSYVPSKFWELFELWKFGAQSRLGKMLVPLKGKHNVPIVIELDPKLKIFTTWGLNYLVLHTKKSILGILN